MRSARQFRLRPLAAEPTLTQTLSQVTQKMLVIKVHLVLDDHHVLAQDAFT